MGTLVSNRKDPKLEGFKFMVIRQIDITGQETKGYVIAADSVGAGVGEIILYATGSSARMTEMTDKKPCDAVIMAIVDQWDINGKLVYHKHRDVSEDE